MSEIELKHQVKLDWIREQGADLRARTQAEYVFTAAAVALFGGVCWGLSGVEDNKCIMKLGTGIVVCVFTYFVREKIIADHNTYDKIWLARGKLIRSLGEDFPLSGNDLFPLTFKSDDGYKISMKILLSAAAFALLFCAFA